MQNFCKIFYKLLFTCAIAAILSCSEDVSSSETVMYPNNGLAFGIYPNDMAKNDSISANISHGVVLYVHPNATYKLSFEADLNYPAPKLQLFRLYTTNNSSYKSKQVRSLSPILVDGRYEYSFICEESKFTMWATTLVLDDTYFMGTTKNVRFTGTGAYSNHMSLNLIAVGNVASKLNGFTLNELSEQLLEQFRLHYTSVIIDTLSIKFAHEHPTLGSKYPANEPWVAGRNSSDMMMTELGGWPGSENALDLVLVHFIDDENILGYSNLFSGNMESETGSTVVLGAYVKSAAGQMPLSINNIIETALHETGHFFGLRHTTSTKADFLTTKDYSNYEDGISDTPYCKDLFYSNMLKKAPQNGTDFRIILPRIVEAYNTQFNLNDCPDSKNYMFPATVEHSELNFSNEQLELLKNNLMIFPH